MKEYQAPLPNSPHSDMQEGGVSQKEIVPVQEAEMESNEESENEKL